MVLSGTPANSRPMEPGDVVEVEVSGLGRLANTVVDWDVDLAGPGEQPAGVGQHAARRAGDAGGRGRAGGGRRSDRAPPDRPRVPAGGRPGRGRAALERPVRADASRSGTRRCAPTCAAATSRTASSWCRASPATTTPAGSCAGTCSLDDAAAPPRRPPGSAHERDGERICLADAGRLRDRAHALPRRAPTARPASPARRTSLPGFRPRKLGHVNCLTGDLAGQTALLHRRARHARVRPARQRGDWLHVNSDHHAMALVNKGYAHFHHLAFDIVDWSGLRVAFDHLGQHGRWLGWGPVRHGIAQNICGYVRITEEPLLRRALLRHGAAASPITSPRLAGRPPLVQHLGPAAAALVLPIRRRGRRATSARASRCCGRSFPRWR